MKRLYGCVLVLGFLTSLTPLAMAQTYDNSPSRSIMFPECIWAAATGGGTWASELQIIDMTGGSEVTLMFRYGTTSDQWRSMEWDSPGVYRSVKYSNILSTMQVARSLLHLTTAGSAR